MDILIPYPCIPRNVNLKLETKSPLENGFPAEIMSLYNLPLTLILRDSIRWGFLSLPSQSHIHKHIFTCLNLDVKCSLTCSQDPDLMTAFSDPEVMAALQDGNFLF